MKSFVIKLNKFFKMDTSLANPHNFMDNKRRLVIPMYQREYKWTSEKIIGLISDISRRDKFLGNVILDEQDNCYEIVDGQQRITTCFLVLVCLYNHYSNSPREQESILSIIEHDNHFVLQNDTVGNFITKVANQMNLDIHDDLDIFSQNGIFSSSLDIIKSKIEELATQGSLRDFKQKLLDSELLVLINDQHTNTSPIEQIFLDINEKAQLLEVEDIFKGHCFENYDEDHYQELRATWVRLKKQGMNFRKIGFESLSQYIYLFLLEDDSLSIPEKLTVAGKHYLDGKDMDETAALLERMISFGDAVTSVLNGLDTQSYYFEDLCANSQEYRMTSDIPTLKSILGDLLTYSSAQYQKLPALYFLYRLKTDDAIKASISHVQFRSIITNLYIYASLFIYSTGKKSKSSIDRTIKGQIDSNPINWGNVVSAAKELRKAQLESFAFSLSRNGYEWLAFVFSIIDFYNANQNSLSSVYRRENGYNLEHFVIPDNRQRKITWNDGENTFDFSLNKEFVSRNKKLSTNYLIMDSSLNGDIGRIDIVSKIAAINSWYEARMQPIPAHIELVIQHIQSLPEYQTLVHNKGNAVDHSQIETDYQNFLDVFFDTEHVNALVSKITDKFKAVFQN